MQDLIHRHFSDISVIYRDIRNTDKHPILAIREEIERLPVIHAADVGCGAGRYDREFFLSLGNRLFLFCIDENKRMLAQLRRYLAFCNIDQFMALRGVAGELPFFSNFLHCIFTFNAIHHFDLLKFLSECKRVLKPGGHLFIYTRLKNQNKRTVWGRYFPEFFERETRLYEIGDITGAIQSSHLVLQSIEYFRYRRRSKLPFLLEQARKHHYSTFCFYKDDEIKDVLEEFNENIKKNFPDTDKVTWIDENTMFIIRKAAN